MTLTQNPSTINPQDAHELKRQLRGRWHELFRHELGDEQRAQSDGWHVFFCPFHNDRNNPNLNVEAETGRFTCFACGAKGGDGFELIKRRHNASFPEAIAIVADIFNLSDPAPKPNGGKRGNGSGKWPEPTAIYTYRDSEGNPYIATLRYDEDDGGKRFSAAHYNESGKRVSGLGNCEKILYSLPAVTRAVNEGRRVVIVEGEKDADRLASENIVATCNPFGSGKWKDCNDDALSGAHVAILPDNDEPGHDHARDVARRLHDKAASIRIVSLGDNREGADVCDYLDIGGDIESVKAAIRDTPEWKPDADDLAFIESLRDADESQPQGSPDTDNANGKRFADQHGDVVAHINEWGWLVFDGQRWNPDNLHLIHKKATETALSIYGEAGQEPDDDKRNTLSKWARQSESIARIEAMIKSARWRVVSRPERFDSDATDYLLNVENGTVDLTSGRLHEHRKSDGITKLAPVTYDPAANADEWRSFLDHIFQGDDELQRYVQKMVGYSLTASTREQCLFVLHGTGANGKSTLLDVLMSLLGDYALQTATSTFTETKYESVPNDVARLAGARFVSAVETSGGQRLNESLVKQMTGGDRISARFLHKEWFDFVAKFKLLLATNHKPEITGNDHAIWRRIKLIPFNVQIPPAAQDKDIADRLVANEASGILNWAIEGCMMWQAEGLDDPEAVRHATASYRREEDVLGDFIADRCVESNNARVETATLYNAYLEWARENGLGYDDTISRHKFTRHMGERGYKTDVQVNRKRGIEGIGLATEDNSDLFNGEDSDDE